MLDIKFIRENPQIVKKNCKNRGYNINIDELLKNDSQWRSLKEEVDKLRHRRNIVTEEIRKLKSQNKDISTKIKEIKEIPEKIKQIESQLLDLRKKIDNILFIIPNILDSTVPIGPDEKYNKVVKTWGKKTKFNFKPKSHFELGKNLDIIDLERSAKLSGAGFYILKGKGAQLQRALVQFMIDFHIKDGFIEINPPQLVNAKTMFGTGNLPKFEQDLYKTQDNFYLIPTAEVPVTNLHANEVLQEKELPKNYVSFTQCFRTEAGKHGSETRGIFRLHQFEKVEMVKITHPLKSFNELEKMRKRAEKICEKLKLPYRTLLLSSGDTGFASAKTYDIEVWAPAAKNYLETSSCSNCTDFQARRMNTKFTTQKGNNFVHTLNGSGLALPRLMISLLENYQLKSGEIKIPTVLQKYCGFKKIEKNEKRNKRRRNRRN